ncbi:hypothetical protein BDV26DRAFT_273418 [Aspergillus bertholletiae]|uniref:C2H2-type domain-containing protein n=1 Tax=Aspergillus bertholletiae TaxID=1226010 RepID=A0A5N7ASG9_9EURO|nr:hypothetical protein BDV26DRAFT_273418 [Aspergillus bertholletiae]
MALRVFSGDPNHRCMCCQVILDCSGDYQLHHRHKTGFEYWDSMPLPTALKGSPF